MTERREQIAGLYYLSNTVKFGSFKLSIHQDHPELPDSPWYLHYPKSSERGSELLPMLHDLIGDEFHDMLETHSPPIEPTRIAGLPNGAWPLAESLARRYLEYPHNLLKFMKIESPGKVLEFSEPEGEYEVGDELQAVEDHISGGRNNRLFTKHARACGFEVTKLLVVVDRQQGGQANMADEGVEVIPIFTADTLLEYGLAEGHITRSRFEEVQEYRAQNQFSLAGLRKGS